MPRYFIDTDDDDLLHIDEEGIELVDDDAARVLAQDALPDMVRDRMPSDHRRTFIAVVRNEAGEVIYRAKLTLTCGWVARGNA